MAKRDAEGYVKEGLSLTKRLHKRLREWEEHQNCMDHTHVDYKELKTMAADANKLLVNLRRQLTEDRVVVTTREQILKQTLKEELIDRDANAARVADRQRFSYEKGQGIASLAQRSEEAVQQINASIVSLCPWQIGLSTSVPMIAAARDQHE